MWSTPRLELAFCLHESHLLSLFASSTKQKIHESAEILALKQALLTLVIYLFGCTKVLKLKYVSHKFCRYRAISVTPSAYTYN